MQDKSLISLALAACITIVVETMSYGQVQRESAPFPTYQQIKPKNQEIIDQVHPNGPATIGTRIGVSGPMNLFDYPPGTVTYYLNDQPTTDVKYVKDVLNNKSISVETISIEAPKEDGKRTIRISYEVL